MAFHRNRVRLERFDLETQYHAAYNFLSLKGALAERWAHGPVFGAYSEQLGSQVTLTPEPGGRVRRRGIYGLRTSAFIEERLRDPEDTYSTAVDWLADVYEVLDPKRTIQISAKWFALYPLPDGRAASKQSRRIRESFYQSEAVEMLLPHEYDQQHVAIDSLCVDGDKHWSLVFGVVGPLHKGTFFIDADKERDEKWWMGLRFTLVRRNEDGLEQAGAAIRALLEEGKGEYERLVPAAYESIF